jgi:hypothetical protein
MGKTIANECEMPPQERKKSDLIGINEAYRPIKKTALQPAGETLASKWELIGAAKKPLTPPQVLTHM